MTERAAIRECRPEEANALLELWRHAETTPSLTDTVEDLQRAVGDRRALVLVAEASGRIIGSVIGGFDGWRANLYRLAVHPVYRRRAIAKRLVAEVERRLADQGAKRVTALVERDHPSAMAFWKAAGYSLDVRMARFVHNL